MPISAHLLKRGYKLIDAGQLQSAEMVIDAVVRADPKNVTAWKAYLQIYQYRNDPDWLMDRILKNNELSEKDKADIRTYQDYLVQNLSEHKQSSGEANPPRAFCFGPTQETSVQDNTVIFELIDEYDYPARKIERENRKRIRQIYKYNIPQYVWQAIALLVLFYAGIRLLVLENVLGYLMMGVFIFGGIRWLRSLNDQKAPPPLDVTHAYSLDTENDLFIINKPVADEKVDKNNKDNSSRIRYLDK